MAPGPSGDRSRAGRNAGPGGLALIGAGVRVGILEVLELAMLRGPGSQVAERPWGREVPRTGLHSARDRGRRPGVTATRRNVESS